MRSFEVKVNNETVDYLERLSFEVDGMKRIIKELISDNSSNPAILENETFLRYSKKYEERNAAYEIAKRELEQSAIPEEIRRSGALLRWNLDFGTGILSFVTSKDFEGFGAEK